MHTRGRRLRLTVVLVVVGMALTGFSTGRHGSRSHHGSGGGGCSNSSQDHDSSSSSTSGGSSGFSGSTSDSTSDSGSGSGTYNRRPNYRSTPSSSSTGSGQSLQDGTATLVSCATKKAPYATVEVKNPNARKGTFKVSVTFMDDQDIAITDDYADVTVPAKGKATVRVKVGITGVIDSVDHCEAGPVAYAR
jgi:hypothetical protein